MEIVLLCLVVVFLVGFGIGYAVLGTDKGLCRGSGSGARLTVGLMLIGCVVMTLVQYHAAAHPHSGAMYAGLLEGLVAIVIGTIGLGLLFSLLLSFRLPP